MPNGRALRGTEPDERLLIEAAQRDPARFAELYELHFERVYAYIARRVRDRDAVQDLTSEVFHQALANIGKFEWREIPFVAWLFRIAGNAIAGRWKRLERERAALPGDTADQFDLEEIEHRAHIFRRVLDLPPDQRRVLEMRFAGQKSIREIAHELDRSEGSVKQLQFRGLETLRAWLRDQNG